MKISLTFSFSHFFFEKFFFFFLALLLYEEEEEGKRWMQSEVFPRHAPHSEKRLEVTPEIYLGKSDFITN